MKDIDEVKKRLVGIDICLSRSRMIYGPASQTPYIGLSQALVIKFHPDCDKFILRIRNHCGKFRWRNGSAPDFYRPSFICGIWRLWVRVPRGMLFQIPL